MIGSTLLLVTQSYPFGYRTDFLEDEIHELAEQFEVVVVAPTAPTGVRQDVPANVRLDPSLAARQTRSRHAFGVLTPFGFRLLVSEVRRRPDCLRQPALLAKAVLAAGAAASMCTWSRRTAGLDGHVVAYTYWLSPLTIGMRRAGIETIVSRAHGGDLFEYRYSHSYIPLQERAIEACDVVASVSDVGADHLRDRHPTVADRVIVERLGISKVSTSRRSDDDVARIVSCSSLTDVKQPALLVRSISELARRRQVRWDHFGDGPLRSVVVDHLRDHPEEHLNAVLHGNVPNTAVFEHYRDHPVDVFVNCSSSEGVPVSIMEAISAGIPVVATSVGGTPEVVQPVCGMLVEPSSTPEELADAMQQLLVDPGSTEDRIEFWAENYDATTNYRRFAEWLRRLGEGEKK